MKRLFMGFLGLLLVSGCATRKEVVRFQSDLATLQNQMVNVQSQNERIQQEIRRLKATIDAAREEEIRTRADVLAAIASFQDQSQYLRNQLDDTGNRMSRLLQSMETQKNRLVPADSTAMAVDYSGMSPQTLYETAYLDLSRKNYELSLQGFMEYLKRYPDSEYANNAQYWIGELFYVHQDYELALHEFRKVEENYPNGQKVPAALLKMGFCLTELNRKSEAKTMFHHLIKNHPQTAEAGLARERLRE